MTHADADDRRRQARGSKRRQEILDAAVELFAARGFRSTGIAELAQRVGLTPPGVLYYFGTKERLLREVVAERDRRAEVMQVAIPEGERRPALSFDAIAEALRATAPEPTLLRLYNVLAAENLDDDDPLHDLFVARHAAGRDFWRSLLEAERVRGVIRDDMDVDAIATEILGTLIGLEVQWLADPGALDLHAAAASYLDRMRASLSPR
jgi:AcrR family transcriptional regulator